jgi:hypothetical protein
MEIKRENLRVRCPSSLGVDQPAHVVIVRFFGLGGFHVIDQLCDISLGHVGVDILDILQVDTIPDDPRQRELFYFFTMLERLEMVRASRRGICTQSCAFESAKRWSDQSVRALLR